MNPPLDNHLVEFTHWIWHKTSVPVFLEKFVLPLFATTVVLLAWTNPMGFDTTQRVTGAIALVFAAYFVGHTVYKTASKVSTPIPAPLSAASTQPSQPQPDNQKDEPPKKSRKLPAGEQPLPRILSEEQIASLTASLQLVAGSPVFITVITENDPETQQLAKQIVTAFQNAKWQISQKIIGKRNLTVIGDPPVSELNPEAGLICTGATLDSDLILKTRSAFNRARVKCLWAKEEVYEDGKPYPLGILIRPTKKN